MMISRRLWLSALFFAAMLFPAASAEVESGMDRPGSDYKSFQIEPSIAGFASCKSSCEADKNCKAWTFVKPGVQGPKAVCYLKNRQAKRIANNCCTSGVPVRKSGCMIAGVNRFDIEDRDCAEAQATGCIKRLLSENQYRNCLAAQKSSGGGGTTSGGGGGKTTGLSGEMQSMLNAHNSYRARHGSPALKWSSSLAKGAQEWANSCNTNHSSFSNGYGENLFWGTNQTARNAADWWYNEIKHYKWNNPIASYVAGDSNRNLEVRHFTQMVWKSTTTLGCGVASCSGQQYFVCRYTPQGNFNGTNPGVLDREVPRLQ